MLNCTASTSHRPIHRTLGAGAVSRSVVSKSIYKLYIYKQPFLYVLGLSYKVAAGDSSEGEGEAGGLYRSDRVGSPAEPESEEEGYDPTPNEIQAMKASEAEFFRAVRQAANELPESVFVGEGEAEGPNQLVCVGPNADPEPEGGYGPTPNQIQAREAAQAEYIRAITQAANEPLESVFSEPRVFVPEPRVDPEPEDGYGYELAREAESAEGGPG